MVEFGNAFYQPLVDHYVSGEDIPLAELHRIWRTTTQLMAWDSPAYEQFYLAVRLMNQKLPASRRVRVLLGDPAVDWTKVRKRADIDWNRDAFLYSVIDREVLAKGRTGLIIAGSGRLGRNTGVQFRPGPTATSRPEVVFGGKTPMNSLADRYPGRIFVALPYTGFGDFTAALEPRVSAWPIPSIGLTNRIPLSDMPYELPFHVDGVEKLPTVPLNQVADALIYYGPRSSLRRVPAPPEIYRDDRYFEELNRMYQIVSEGRGLNRAELLRDKTNDPIAKNPNR